MNHKSILLAVGLCISPWAAPAAATPLSETIGAHSVSAGICQSADETITGKLGAFVHGGDGMTYFMLDSKLCSIDTKLFLEAVPEPVFGMTLTAVGSPDPNKIVDYVCTKLSRG